MIKLRELLDQKGIKWTDESETIKAGDIGFTIDRTHFEYKRKKISVINGYGTRGGVGIFSNKNEGLLEFYDYESEPIGYLTAEEVMKVLEKYDEN